MENSNRRMTRTVGLVGVIGVSIAGMAPTLAMNLNPQQLASHVGSAVPLVFALATVAVLLIAWCFARLSRVYPTSGSVYRYVGETLGVRTGVVSGWSMLGAYFCFAGLVISGFAIFMSSLLDATGIWSGANADVLAICGTALVLVLSLAPVHRVTVVLLLVEVVSVLAMLVLAVFVFVQVDLGSMGLGAVDLFVPSDGIPFSEVALAMSFGLLSFAGFEQAATLGEDAIDPRRQIPIALIGTTLFAGLAFVIITAAEVAGIYDTKGGMSAFANAPGLLQTLGDRYVSDGAGDVFAGFAVASALAGALGLTVATTRLIFTFARDLIPTRAIAKTSARGEMPRVGIVFCALIGLVEYGFVRVVCGGTPDDSFFWWSTAGALLILVPYMLLSIGAGTMFARLKGIGRLEIIIPVLAVAVIAYTLMVNVFPLGEGAYRVIPFLVMAWIAVAIVATIVWPSLLQRVHYGLLGNQAES